MKQNRRSFLRNTALAGGAVTLRSLSARAQASVAPGASAVTAQPEIPASASIRRQFQSPPKKYRPIVRWWWPGNDVEDAELRREIDVLDKGGLGGAEIQAFIKGLDMKNLPAAQIERMNSFATPSFFRHVAVAAEEARNRGMFIDYTFGSGWPFGGGDAITPEFASVELRFTHLSVAGPAKLHEQLQIPSVTDGDPLTGVGKLDGLPDGWADRMKKRSRLVAVVAVRGQDAHWGYHQSGPRHSVVTPGVLENGTSVNLTSRLQPDGTLDWDVPPGTWQLFVFCSLPRAQRVNAGAGPGPQLVMDHFSAEAFRAYAKRVGDNAIPYLGQYFGDGLRAIFCDSLEVGAYLFWSDDFLAEFERRRGYDLVPYLPILRLETDGEPFGEFVDLPVYDMAEIGDQVRHDYQQTVSDLITERFYSQFNQWAHDHKLLSRTQAHGAPADVLRIYGEADIPETEDLYDRGGYDFLKMAASSANVYGRAIVGSESFVWPTSAYQTTPEKMKLAADELFTAGVNAIVYHGFPYIVPQVPPPGWHPFIGIYGDGNYSSQLNELNPLWPYLAQLNRYMTRVQFISQTGSSVAALALYRNDLAHGAGDNPPSPKLNQAIMDAGYNYDHINADSLLHCDLRERMLATPGGARYRALVFPPLDSISAPLAEKLQGFAAAGLPIFFSGQTPLEADGYLHRDLETNRVNTAMHAIHNAHGTYFSTNIADLITMLQKAVDPNIRFHSKALSFIQKRIGRLNAFFLRNDTDVAQHLDAEFEAEGEPELWDPWTGGTASIAAGRRNAGWVGIHLDLQPLASALIVFDPEREAPPATAAPAPRTVQRTQPIGAAGWKLTATGLVPSGKTAVIRRDLPLLVDWSLDAELRGFSGRAVYTTSFAVPAANNHGRLILDLGTVRDVAEITVNGKQMATLLLRPYEVDITDSVQPGENQLEVAVTNTLFNSMALREPPAFRPGFTENLSGLMSAGLIGPVQIKIMN